MHWIPYGGERRRGRPATRWEDSLEAYAREYASKWEVLAQARDIWSAWEEALFKELLENRREDSLTSIQEMMEHVFEGWLRPFFSP